MRGRAGVVADADPDAVPAPAADCEWAAGAPPIQVVNANAHMVDRIRTDIIIVGALLQEVRTESVGESVPVLPR